ncbi:MULTISPECIES: signal peptidase II [unclassified Arthrobacter]|uniref:signal peptidase II n=1 Tax=unclassified Arthrobacter TaxID=235627 RepID=UPI001D15DEC5|nr:MULTISPECIES: signal peptidase II [unclassified Arthrobacter]MCC3274330.1 signal peptidase II [Arthrobacter sp. zg-Y20]MCC9178077.1 signal peptidase II [Arthrobacter sp. zg-Y750]MDK1314486.1 signal peptidase II [Arthrobacter sp. zg.Y20]WIB07470.1 signal peptidase II [Arthrobacter sp. zg-Y20]
MTNSSPDTPQDTGARRPAKAKAAFAMLALAAAALVADQLTKLWVVRTMTEGQVTDVLPPLLRWHFIRNPGAAFSIGTEFTWVFTIIMVLVSGFLVYLMIRVRSLAWATALGLVLGGALGNLTDRLFRAPSFGQGHVVDFIAFPNFAIFNIADSCVVCGVILVCLLTLRGISLDGTRTLPAAKEPAAANDGEEQR